MQQRNCRQAMIRAAAAAALCAAGISRSAKAADSTGMVTWSVSGSTAMRNFTVGIPGTLDGGLTTLETPLTLSLSNGSYGAGTAGLQLSPLAFSGANLTGGTG